MSDIPTTMLLPTSPVRLPIGVAAAPGDVFLMETDAARVLRLSCRTLQRHRTAGTGPKFIRLSVRRLAYRLSDLQSWVASRVVGITPVRVSPKELPPEVA
jgi:predicted DNA-binding transcriptional regulator AlpA